jgi:formylglycine-generating enzyme required for sulfatase activity
MDFGLARRIRGEDSRLTQKRTALGTPAYMPPEQVSGDVAAMGPASDVYSLGVIFYELLTGRLPFRGDSMSVLSQVLMDDPPPPSQVRQGIDPKLEAVCLKAMARKIEDRCPSMEQLAALLTKALGARLPADTSTPPARHPNRSSRRWLIAAGVGIALVAGALVCASGVLGLKTRERTSVLEDDAGKDRDTKPTPIPEPPKEITNSIGMKLVLIPKGKFLMGSPASEMGRGWTEDPHEVEITRAFYMGAYTATQAEYQNVMGHNPSAFAATGHNQSLVRGINTSRFPVEQVNWHDAVAFCNKLSALAKEKQAKRVYRLPTEAEWEYACRAGTKTAFNCGDRLAGKANFFENRAIRPRTCEVGSYKPNAWGLYDMHGNVFQWCSDWLGADTYKQTVLVVQDPQGPKIGSYRILRGGCWLSKEPVCRSANRASNFPHVRRLGWDGIRVVCVPEKAR